ncbi:type-F conjugative transfer system pilin assembly protein TrbC [Pseudoduganella umbonata]|nr:type-F conjugative transfer system pilin assembly protein TrbC [Pseudoduganella umbonata]MBB3221714.1 type-F conjugative transfer system pilin assembly protein TrbC [Pseudoduganella umbonata]
MAIAILATVAMAAAASPGQQAGAIHHGPAPSDATIDVLQQAEQLAKGAMAVGSPASQPTEPDGVPSAPLPTSARLYVFVSFSMPPASLRQLASQAAKAGVPLVLRGMVEESLSATARRTAQLIETAPGASVEIDPGPFRRFGITRVPAYLIAAPAPACKNACVPEDAGPVIVGDVTLYYALERLAQGASAPLAQYYLDRLRRKP